MKKHTPAVWPEGPGRQEFLERLERLHGELCGQGRDWDAAFIVERVNQYYFSGTMQDGVLVLRRDGQSFFFARKSYERAREECVLPVYPMTSYRDVAQVVGENMRSVYIETEVVTLGLMERMKKYFKIENTLPVQGIIGRLRAVKSPYELICLEEAGRQHGYLLGEVVPGLLREGMTEAELMALVYQNMVLLGHQGVTRFSMFQTESVMGQLGFGENSIYPSRFNGPGGMRGASPASPDTGSRERRLKKGDLVFVDTGFGVNGYHTDCTRIYMFGGELSAEAARLHGRCLDIQRAAAGMLRPGNIPGEIYESVIAGLDSSFLENFMGVGEETVKFLGHGIGLQIDEGPVIAAGFRIPLAENIVMALEPKKSISGFGIVGIEDTFVVTKEGGRRITGGEQGIIVV